MNEQNSKPRLDELLNQYRETKAPPGFAQRVTANLEKPAHRQVHIPRFAVAASVGAIAIVSLVLVQSVKESDPANQANSPLLASGKQAQTETPKRENDNIQLAEIEPAIGQVQQKTEKSEEPSSTKQPVVTETIVASTVEVQLSQEEIDKFYSKEHETDESSLAVLTDISDWLVTQPDTAAPDITDLPDISDLDSLFETT